MASGGQPNNESETVVRPKRITHPPKYLNEYVVQFPPSHRTSRLQTTSTTSLDLPKTSPPDLINLSARRSLEDLADIKYIRKQRTSETRLTDWSGHSDTELTLPHNRSTSPDEYDSVASGRSSNRSILSSASSRRSENRALLDIVRQQTDAVRQQAAESAQMMQEVLKRQLEQQHLQAELQAELQTEST